MVPTVTCRQGEDAPPARVIVFAASEAQAVMLAEPLRNVLWGEHTLAVLLPGGQEPIQVRASLWAFALCPCQGPPLKGSQPPHRRSPCDPRKRNQAERPGDLSCGILKAALHVF